MARAQYFDSMEPILVRRSLRTPSSPPEFTSERCNVIMSERRYAMADGCRILVGVNFAGVLQRLP
jgi:hypothetical protein